MLRVRFADPEETWLYLDPTQGGIVQRSVRVTVITSYSIHYTKLYESYHRAMVTA